MLANQFLFSTFFTPETLKNQRKEKSGISFKLKDIFWPIWFVISLLFYLNIGILIVSIKRQGRPGKPSFLTDVFSHVDDFGKKTGNQVTVRNNAGKLSGFEHGKMPDPFFGHQLDRNANVLRRIKRYRVRSHYV